MKLTVTDSIGESASATHTITRLKAPTASFTAPTTDVKVGQTVSFDGSASSDPNPGGRVRRYAWTFGDGGTATGATATHA